MSPRRSRLLLALGIVALLSWASSRGRAGVDGPPPARREVEDLHAIFQDEMSGKFQRNIYAGLGNRFQIDGKAYNHVFLALNAYDRMKGAETSEPFAGREAWAEKQLGEARKEFAAMLAALDWPRVRVEVAGGEARLAPAGRLEAWERVPQPVLVEVRNTTAESREITLASPGLGIAPARVAVGPSGTRWLLGSLDAQRAGTSAVDLRVSVASASRTHPLRFEVGATGVLEGTLADPSRADRPAARIRITAAGGKYVRPESHRYGLILKMFGPEHDQIAERWFFADGTFRARVPAGTATVQIRKGLEYTSTDEAVRIEPGRTTTRTFALSRWADMKRRGWISGDIHFHYLDPENALFELAAEDLHVGEVFVMNEAGAINSREYFTGAVDVRSTPDRQIKYDEEFRNGNLGHLGLLNLKRLVEPVSTGRIGALRPQFFRNAYFTLRNEPRGNGGEPGFPDRLLVDAMRETHRQGGIVNLAHLRRELEFQLDAALGELDTVDILTDTELHKEALPFWYHMLNCGFRLPATGGTDRAAAHIPLGHQRVYVQMTGKFDYARWLEGIRRGNSFATNGPMVTLTVDGSGPGAELRFPAARRVRIRAEASSQLPFEKLEIVVNGKAIRQAAAGEKGRAAALDFETEVGASAWIAARALGSQHPEIMYYPHPEWSHPVAAHTSPVYVRVGESRIAIAESACFLLERMHKLEQWATTDAYFGDAAERERALGEIRKGTEFYRKMCGR